MTHRTEQIESTLRRVISDVLTRQLADPRVRGLVSVTEVKVSPDRKQAHVFFSVIPQKYESRTLHALQSAWGYIHTKVFKAVSMKTVPTFEFRLDRSMKQEAVVLAAIRQGVDKEQATSKPQKGSWNGRTVKKEP